MIDMKELLDIREELQVVIEEIPEKPVTDFEMKAIPALLSYDDFIKSFIKHSDCFFSQRLRRNDTKDC